MKTRLGRGMKMGLNKGPNSRTFNKRNEQTRMNKLERGLTIVEGLDKLCLCDEIHNNDLVKLLKTCLN